MPDIDDQIAEAMEQAQAMFTMAVDMMTHVAPALAKSYAVLKSNLMAEGFSEDQAMQILLKTDMVPVSKAR